MSDLKLTLVAVTATSLITIVLRYCFSFYYGGLKTSLVKLVAVTATSFSDLIAGISDLVREGLVIHDSFVSSAF